MSRLPSETSSDLMSGEDGPHWNEPHGASIPDGSEPPSLRITRRTEQADTVTNEYESDSSSLVDSSDSSALSGHASRYLRNNPKKSLKVQVEDDEAE